MTNGITLYDIRNTAVPGRALSPFVWRIRYALNIKGLEHKTTWIGLTEIAGQMQKLGVPQTEGGRYTVPTIVDPATGRAVTDSIAIAEYLDEQYPDTPVLVTKGSREAQLRFAHSIVQGTLYKAIVPISTQYLLGAIDEELRESFRTSSEKQWGKKFEDIAPKGEDLAVQLKKIKSGLDEIAKAIADRSGKDALFFGGDRPVFADIALAGTITQIRGLLGDDHDVVKLIFSANGGRWTRFMEAFSRLNAVY